MASDIYLVRYTLLSLLRKQREGGHSLLFAHLTYVQLPWYTLFDGKHYFAVVLQAALVHHMVWAVHATRSFVGHEHLKMNSIVMYCVHAFPVDRVYRLYDDSIWQVCSAS